MCDTRYWTKEFLTDFISLYKSHPALWKVKSKEYANKQLKEEAYMELINKCRTVYPQADRNFVFKKIQSVRGVFRKELRKIDRSKREGGEIYIPTLWYFDQLLFTKDLETNRSSDYLGEIGYSDDGFTQSPENTYDDDGEFVEDEGNDNGDQDDEGMDDMVQMIEPEVTINESQPQVPPIYTRPIKSERYTPYEYRPNRFHLDRRTQSTLSNLSSNLTISRAPGGATLSNEYEAFSVNIAAKLQKMDEMQRIFAESLISQIMYKGLLKQLDENTIIVKTEGNMRPGSLDNSTASSSTPIFTESLISQIMSKGLLRQFDESTINLKTDANIPPGNLDISTASSSTTN